MNWQKLELLSARFKANCDALETRDAALAGRLAAHRPPATYVLASEGEQLLIGAVSRDAAPANVTGRIDDSKVERLTYRLTPAGAKQIVQKLCPADAYTEPALVVGLDLGWLWQMLYELPCSVPIHPGNRPPLFLLARTIEQLWIAAHIHDWRTLLADTRVCLFVGDDAIVQLERSLMTQAALPGPRVSVTLDAAIWPAGMNLDAMNLRVMNHLNARLADATEQFKTIYGQSSDESIAARLRSGGKLRIMGMTSLYTTFLQHSMRDWLAAFAAAGHDTRLVIEQSDHLRSNSLVLAEACAEFKPDLFLMIDHYRAEMGGLPEKVPCVMWVQDYLPSIHKASAGAAQGHYDYVIGYARAECTSKHGYPIERFMPAMVAVNETRFAPAELSSADQRELACDVSYVSHASRTPESFIAEQIAQNPGARPLLADAFDRLKSIYDDGHSISHPLHVRGIIEEAMRQTRTGLDATSMEAVTDHFALRINNAFLRHQSLLWAAEMGLDFRLYGNGWENHPTLKKYARGSADNKGRLAAIYRATRINLQVTPHGAVHQRMLEGLACGGFFLIRYVPGDRVGQIYRPLWEWCVREGIETDEQILQHATPDVLKILGEFQRTVGLDPFKLSMRLMDDIRVFADLDFAQSAAAVWPEYETVAFDSRAALQQRIKHFLAHEDQRQELTASMREKVLQTATYSAVNRRMLDFIANNLASAAAQREAA